ncbi:hypothetical protein RJT34_19672 [Clitoria ternatea]|uniref:Uncharacterized protein n=1 Tax=Clitoria ternatea TaxID=43366 RepID=A0AAN9IRH0_CLITE
METEYPALALKKDESLVKVRTAFSVTLKKEIAGGFGFGLNHWTRHQHNAILKLQHFRSLSLQQLFGPSSQTFQLISLLGSPFSNLVGDLAIPTCKDPHFIHSRSMLLTVHTVWGQIWAIKGRNGNMWSFPMLPIRVSDSAIEGTHLGDHEESFGSFSMLSIKLLY